MSRLFRVLILSSLVAGLAACGGTVPIKPTSNPEVDRKNVVEYLNKVDIEADKKGDPQYAIKQYRAVAKKFERNEEPWVRLSKRAFDEEKYAAAAKYSHEALNRNEQNTVAASVLAASGLRISLRGLQVLRDKNGEFSGTAEAQAKSVVQLLKDVLGTEGLVSNKFQPAPVVVTPPPVYVAPPPAVKATTPKPPRKPRKPRKPKRKKYTPKPPAVKPPVKKAPTVKPKPEPKPTNNPFDRLGG